MDTDLFSAGGWTLDSIFLMCPKEMENGDVKPAESGPGSEARGQIGWESIVVP